MPVYTSLCQMLMLYVNYIYAMVLLRVHPLKLLFKETLWCVCAQIWAENLLKRGPAGQDTPKKAPWRISRSPELTTNFGWGPQAHDYIAGLEHRTTAKSKALPSASAAVSLQNSRTELLLTLHQVASPSHAPFPLMNLDSLNLSGLEAVNIIL